MIELQIGAGEDLPELDIALGLMADAIGSMEPTWRNVVHPWINNHMEQQLKTQGEHGGEPWAGYGAEPKYEAYKKSRVGHLKVLRWYPDIRNGMLPPSLYQETHPMHRFWAGDSHVTIGTRVPWAWRLTQPGTNQFGESRPARPIYRFTRQQISGGDGLISLIQQDIVNRVGADTLRRARGRFQQKLHSAMLGR